MTPERSNAWLSLLVPVAERGGPLLTLALAVMLGGAVWYLLGALTRAVDRNHVLVEKLLAQQESHRAELLRYVHCPPQP